MFSMFSKIALVSLVAVLIRLLVAANTYSGQGKPPMYGDYEAQRHWMEITYHLPVEKWYENGTMNNLEYWGLDYPPLTAYHSHIMGAISHRINASWVELNTSHGIQDESHKLFMRYSVLAVDLLLYIPAVMVYCWVTEWQTLPLLHSLLALLYPGLILIDHGHFQYNNMSLGLVIWAVIGLSKGHDLLASVAFVLALNYKQMELYHAMPFFCYLLGKTFKGSENSVWRLFKLGAVVLVTFGLCWLPFLSAGRESCLQVLHRIFPFARGLYEDKVANVWCSLAVILKLKQIFDIGTLVKLCLLTTFLTLIPSSLHLLVHPTVNKFKYALINSSLIFFLFSFQVHEKSILIPAIVVCLVLPSHPFISSWFLLISTFSMLPLLIKDGLFIPYCVLTPAHYIFTSVVYDSDPPCNENDRTHTFFKLCFGVSVLGVVALSGLSVAVSPPAHLPDLFPVAIATYSCLHLLIFLVYFHYRQFKSPDDVITSESKNKVISKKYHKSEKKMN